MYRLICALLVIAVVGTGCSAESTVSAQCSATAPVAGNASSVDSSAGKGGGAKLNGPQPAFDPARVILPSALYMVAGETYRLEYARIIASFEPNMDVTISGHERAATTCPTYWEYTPRGAESFPLSIVVKNGDGETVLSESRHVVVSARPSGGDLRHLSIGDSITRAGGYADMAVRTILGGQTVGTRTYDGTYFGEGRGGWTVKNYMNRVGDPAKGDSPFLFPVGVDGGKYLGNTSFWRDVTVGNSEGYDFRGFQAIARGWKGDGPYLFDSNGYPRSPTAGDVVIDPSQADGTQWRKFSGSTWMVLEPEPDIEFSFAKYLDRFASAYSAGLPTAISIMLGTVDFLSSLTDESWSAYRAGIDTLIESIRTWDEDVPIIIIAPPSGGPEEMWADRKVTGAEFNQRMIEHSRRLFAAYDTPEKHANNIYTISFLGTVSAENMADYVHPKDPDGHKQMAPWMAGMLAHLISEGSI
uniref:SGNH hydrolase-type esterase domain-containing protein n=2 Tax=unclassified Mycobacterium TaxID=2642494 RepID=A0A5Q5BFS8_MYCSS